MILQHNLKHYLSLSQPFNDPLYVKLIFDLFFSSLHQCVSLSLCLSTITSTLAKYPGGSEFDLVDHAKLEHLQIL